jgi:hypothetical protein
MVRICCCFALIVAAVSPARAGDNENEPTTTFHKGQFGVSARMGLGGYGIATWDVKYYCGKLDTSTSTGNAPVCTGRSPLALDLEASYGVGKAVEITLELELGFEHDFGAAPGLEGPRPLHLAPGARFFFSEAAHTKLFAQPELVIDFANYTDAAGVSRGTDLGIRGIEGFWVDLHRSYGLYVFVSETAEFSRWLYIGFAGGVGFQGRYP